MFHPLSLGVAILEMTQKHAMKQNKNGMKLTREFVFVSGVFNTMLCHIHVQILEQN